MSRETTTTCKVMIVEDEAIVQLHLRRLLTSLGYQVTGAAASAAEAMELARQTTPDLVLMDIRLRGEVDGVATAMKLREAINPAIVFLTAFADKATVQRTEEVGAVGYIVKPYNRNEIRAVLTTAVGIHRRQCQAQAVSAVTRSNQPSGNSTGPFHGMIGDSAVIRAVHDRILDVARLNWTVLIEGPTGSGKELTARALHAESGRGKGPFVAVNCAGLTDTLLASQLFGHKRGTFTGAAEDQKGFFESANGGTLFLDEVADISASGQQALLRVLEEGAVQRIGESKSRPVDVRILSATQRDLAAEVAAGRFRADLLYRLRAVRVALPPLCERGNDILLLARYFLDLAVEHTGRQVTGFSEDAQARLLSYPWPGNVRELRHAVEHGVLACRRGLVGLDDLPPELNAEGSPESLTPRNQLQQIEKALERTGGNRKEAARLLNISRATLYRRFTALGINGGEDDSSDA